MKQSFKWILALVVFALFIGGASVLYNHFKKDFVPENSLPTQTSATEPQSEETVEEQETEEAQDALTPAPDFTVLDKDGNPVRLSDFRGKPVVLNFWASWCYYCKLEMPEFDEVYKTVPDVQFMMVDITDGHSETLETAKSFIESTGYTFPVFYDTSLEASSQYDTGGIPITYFIDRDGNLVTYYSGAMPRETLEYALTLIQ